MADPMIREAIEHKSLQAKTKRLDLSFNELMSMYESGELEIKPNFQRIFVWSKLKQSQFIESLMLELPVPPIYVVEVEDGKYELVDGLQRLSSYLHFRGVLDNPFKNIKKGDFLKLEGCDIAPEINGISWNDLELALQIKLKRAFVSVQVIRKNSDQHYKYHMFKRLNDGGVPISPQQIRNCVIRMLDQGDKVVTFLGELSQDPNYVACCADALTEDQRDEQFDIELVLRFFAFKNWRKEFVHDVRPFLDEFMEAMAGQSQINGAPFDFEKERDIFRRTFEILRVSMGEIAFTYPNRARTDLTKGFSALHFEGVTAGLQKWLSKLDVNDDSVMQKLRDALKKVRLSDKFRAVSSGGGRNSPGTLGKRIQIIEDAIADVV